MYCQYCGKEIPDDAVICVGCGRQIKPLADPSPKREDSIQPPTVVKNAWPAGTMLVLVIASMFIPFVGIVFGILGLLDKDKKEQGALLLAIGIFYFFASLYFLSSEWSYSATNKWI